MTNNLSQFPKEVGEAKYPKTQTDEEVKEQLEIMGSQEHEELSGVSSALKITPYDLPEGLVDCVVREYYWIKKRNIFLSRNIYMSTDF